MKRILKLVSVFFLAWSLSGVADVQGSTPHGTDGVTPSGTTFPDPFTQGSVRGYFTENLGQWGDHVSFVAPSTFGEAVFGTDGVTYIVRGGGGGHRVKVAFGSDRSVEPKGLDARGPVSNYLLGSDPFGWVTGVRSYGELLYEDVWPGVDVRYRFQDRCLKYDVIIDAEADPGDVRFTVEGALDLDVGPGELDFRLSSGLRLQDRDLVASYDDGESVDVRFVRHGDGFGFEVEKESGRALVIDPLVVAASTFLGGTYEDRAVDVELAADGDIYVTGTTASFDYPVTTGAFMEAYVDRDIIVTKLSRDCSQVLWSTYIGGGAEDLVSGLDLDDADDAYLMGTTLSTDFPTTEGALQTTNANANTCDMFVLRLRSDGVALEYSTYLGGRYDEVPGDIAVHAGIAYVVGRTDSPDFQTGDSNFTVTAGDAFLLMLDHDGGMLRAKCWGGSRNEWATTVRVTDGGDVVVGGYTWSSDFPTTPGAYKERTEYYFLSFVLRYRPSTDTTLFATLLGEFYVRAEAIALDVWENVYVTGWAFNSTAMQNFPTTEGAFDRTYNGRADGFVAKLDADGSRLEYATLVGGNGEETMGDIEVDSRGNAIVVGYSLDGAEYPVTPGCLDPLWESAEGFVFVLNANGSAPVYSTFIGGTMYDEVIAVEVTERDTLVIAGSSNSVDLATTEGAFQTRPEGNRDILVSELCVLSPPGAPIDVCATGGEDNITVVWLPPPYDGGYPIENYLVLRGPTDDGLVPFVALGNETRLVDLDVEYGVPYCYAVRAFNGRGLGPMSGVATAMSLTVPDAPANLTGIVELTAVLLRWDAPAFTGGLPLTAYRLYRGTSEATMQPHATVPAGLNGCSDTDVVDRTTYIYELASVTAYGESRARCRLTLRNTGPPTPPQGLDHTYGDLYIRLTWEAVDDDYGLPVKGYNIYRRTVEGDAVLVGTSHVGDRWFLDLTVEVGTLYRYSVTAQNAKGESEPSEGHEASAVVVPWPPRDVAASALEHIVRVTWSPPEFDGASPLLRYKVYYGVDPGDMVCVGGVSVAGGAGVELEFLHDIPYDGVLRHYYVTAVNAEGEGLPSTRVLTQMYQVPGPPRSLLVERGNGRLTLVWQPPGSDGGTAVRSYTLYRMADIEDVFVALVTLPATTLRYVDDTTENGVGYTYQVTASNLAGEGDPSLDVSEVPAGPPGPPRLVSAEGANRFVRLTWASPASSGGLPIMGYRIYGISEGLQVQLLAELGPVARFCELIDLVNGGVYHYALRALSAAGESELSDIVEGRPVGPPSAPQGLVALWLDDHICVMWSTPSDTGGAPIRGYRLHREDWEAGNWTEVDPLELLFRDIDVELQATYNYTLYAYNDLGGGPSVRLTFTVPPAFEPPPEDALSTVWQWAIAAVVLCSTCAFLINLWRRRRGGEDLGTGGD